MFTPRIVLEARDWLQRGNPRQAALRLLEAGRIAHRDWAKVCQEVGAALVQTAQQEQAHSVWAAWEALELAQKLAPLNGHDRELYQKLNEEIRRRGARQEAVDEVKEQAEQWLREGRIRDVVQLLQQFLDGLGDESVSGRAWKLRKMLTQAQARLETFQTLIDPIRQALENQDFLLALERCEAAGPEWAGDPELRALRRQARSGAAQSMLRQAEDAATRGEIEAAERLVRQARKFMGEGNTAWLPDFERIEKLVADRRREFERERRAAEVERRLRELREALDASDLPLAFQKFHQASRIVPADDPEFRSLRSRLMALEQDSRSGASLAQAVRDRQAQFVLANQWLILSKDEIRIGGRGAEQADLRVSAPIPKRHALLVRDRQGYTLHPLASRSGADGCVWVNGQVAETSRRLRHGDEIAWHKEAGKWRLEMPVAGSLTAALVLQDDDGCPVATARGLCRSVLLLAEEAVLGGERGRGVHAVLRGLPGRLRLVWRGDGLYWQAEGMQLVGSGDESDCGGIVCVPSEWRLAPRTAVDGSEADWLRGAFRERASPGGMCVSWSWA
jgi:hypothetical protein